MSRYNVFSGSESHEEGFISNLYPLHPIHEYNSTFPNASWPIGFDSGYPEKLKKRLCAALIATQLGLKSVDHVMKTYLHDVKDEPTRREDSDVSDYLSQTHSYLYDLVHKLTHHDDGCIGRILAEWALLRQEFSFIQLLTLANRGALFEGLVVARMQLEQLAWICAIDREVDPERIRRVQAQSSLSNLKAIEPRVGRFYGYLSNHAHWGSTAHVRAISADNGQLGVVFASSRHKIELYMALLLLADIQTTVVFTLRANEISGLADSEGHIQRRTEISRLNEEWYELLGSRIDGRPDKA